jgi:hypothetical protein
MDHDDESTSPEHALIAAAAVLIDAIEGDE